MPGISAEKIQRTRLIATHDTCGFCVEKRYCESVFLGKRTAHCNKQGAIEILFNRFDSTLRNNGYLPMSGQMRSYVWPVCAALFADHQG